jgi:hypothetical protein
MFAILLMILGAPAAVYSDTLIVDEMESAQATADSRPSRGMTMEKVAETWGDPVSRPSPVGDPPIARWEYDQFVVYFEYQNVIHAVAKP